MSFTRPFRLLGLLPLVVHALAVNLYPEELSISVQAKVSSSYIILVQSKSL